MGRKKFRTAYFELTNVCNASCPFCKGSVRKKGFMEEALFRKLVLEAQPFTEQGYLHVMGEALLHPAFRSMVSFADEKGFPLSLTTNGTLFGTENAASLFTGAFRQINVSLHAGLALEHLDEIFALLDGLKKHSPGTFCNLRMWNTASPGRERVLESFSSFFGMTIPVFSGEPFRISEKISVHYDPEFVWPSLEDPECGCSGTCRGAVKQFAVLYDGTVTVCCLDSDGIVNCGNASGRPLQEILSSGRFEKIRNAFLRGEVLEDLCRKCSYRLRFTQESKTARQDF